MKLDLLKDMMRTYGMKPLAEKAGVSRMSLYNLVQGENFESETLEKVSKVLGLEFGVLNKTPSYENVCDHLAHYGAPLLRNQSKDVTMSLEETSKWGLQFSKDDGLLESVMPYFLLLNFKNLNRVKLLSLLDQENQFQLLGYFLELAFDYSKNRQLKSFFNLFYRDDFLPLYFGIEKPSERALEVLRSKKNLAAKKWNVMTFGSTLDYFERFKKWDKHEKAISKKSKIHVK